MKFVCERCQTKYSIADEKVRQKVLKIRCKTCENVITIRDAVVVTEPAVPRAEPPPTPVGAGAGARSVEWHLAISGQQTGPFGLAALVTRILAADRNDEVYVWNEHLDGWKEPKQIPEVAAELRARAAAVEPPQPPVKRAPTPAAGHHGRGGNPAPVVSRGGRSSGAMAAAAQLAPSAREDLHESFEEKTQISPLDASVMLDPHVAPTRGQPSLSLLAKNDKSDKSDKGAADRQDNKHDKAAAHTNGHHGAGARKTAAGMPSGLEALDFAPPLVAPSQPAAPGAGLGDLGAMPAPAAKDKAVPVPVVGGNTSMLLAQVGARASRPRHPAVKFVAFGTVLLGLGGVIAFVTLRDGGEKTAKVEAAPAPAADPKVDPEAQARAEAEKYFKSMVGETKSAPAPVTKTVAPPAPKKTASNNRGKGSEPSLAPPSLAPPPVGSTPAPSAGDGSRVTSRFGQEERRVAVPTKTGNNKADEDFDPQKVTAVFKQPDHLLAVKSCYERALKRDASMKLGRLDITVNVGELGSAKKVTIAAPPEFAMVKTCIQDSVRRWRFPPNVKEYEAAYTVILAGNSGG